MTHGVKKRAYFRFYEELNYFLPKKLQKTTFFYRFWGKPSVKNAIQAIGIPHTEVDLVLVNGEPVDFSYNIHHDDRISVYPVFESFDIGSINILRDKPLRNLSFIVDANLGKLARLLRMLGFDTLYDNRRDDKEIIRISNEQMRIILTRDYGILKQNAVTRGYFLKNQDPKNQLEEVIRRFDLLSEIQPFTRCMECNGVLLEVEKESILDQLDEETKKLFNKFFQCNSCRKVYWKGSHYERMKEMIEALAESIR